MTQSVITIKEATDKGKTISIVDINKTKYTLWKTSSKGGSNPAFDEYLRIGGVGATIWIEFQEKDDSFQNDKGEQVNYTKRTIYKVQAADAPRPAPQQSAVPKASKPAAPAKEETDWDSIAVGKCQTAFLAAYIQSGKSISDAMLQVSQAKKLAELVAYGPMAQTPGENIYPAPEATSEATEPFPYTPTDVVEQANQAVAQAQADDGFGTVDPNDIGF